MTKETYYAVLIGRAPKHKPYFMVREDALIPHLFLTEKEARDAMPKQSEMRVVKVYLHD